VKKSARLSFVHVVMIFAVVAAMIVFPQDAAAQPGFNFSPKSGPPGTKVEVTVTGAPSGESLTVEGNGQALCSFTIGNNGAGGCAFTVPKGSGNISLTITGPNVGRADIGTFKVTDSKKGDNKKDNKKGGNNKKGENNSRDGQGGRSGGGLPIPVPRPAPERDPEPSAIIIPTHPSASIIPSEPSAEIAPSLLPPEAPILPVTPSLVPNVEQIVDAAIEAGLRAAGSRVAFPPIVNPCLTIVALQGTPACEGTSGPGRGPVQQG
jgi:hypothetical protein